MDVLDALIRDFLARAGVTASQFAICRDGTLIFNRAYAAKPPSGYPAVATNTLFRIASNSKMFTCAGITALRSRGDLDMDSRVFSLLGISAPALRKDKPDPHIDEITVQHLVDHAGGWNDHDSFVAKDGTHISGTDWDPTFNAREIALNLNLDRPPTKLEVAAYMYGRRLQFVPGTQNFYSTGSKSYSNFGYMLLGMVIEKVSGQPYIDFIRTGLGADTDVSNVFLSRLLDQIKNPREVWYTCPDSRLTQLKPRSSDFLKLPYGGGFIPELIDSAGGLMTNAATLALFSSRHAAWGLGDRAPDSGRSGSFAGTSSFTFCRPNGIDAAFVLNINTFDGGPKEFDDFVAAFQTLINRL